MKIAVHSKGRPTAALSDVQSVLVYDQFNNPVALIAVDPASGGIWTANVSDSNFDEVLAGLGIKCDLPQVNVKKISK